MKVRSVKLREAHKASSFKNGRAGSSFCSVVWDQQAHHLITTSVSDPSISIHDPLLPSSAPKILRHHCDGVIAIASTHFSTISKVSPYTIDSIPKPSLQPLFELPITIHLLPPSQQLKKSL
ncbi:hypothetical protein ACJW30_02G114300 [Castanea mollissima]